MADFEDLFTGAANTNLTEHTPDVGTAWTGGGTTQDNALLTGNGEIKAESNESLHTIFADDLGSPDHQIWFAFSETSGAVNARTCCRVGDSSNNSYAIGAAMNLGDVNITYRDGGSTNGLTQHTHGFNYPYWIKLKCEGDTVSAFKSQSLPTNPEEDTDWTLIGSWTVSVNNTVQKPGLFLFGTSVQSADANPFLDSFYASALTGGDTTAPTLTNASGSETGATTASGSVDTDEGNGTLYHVTTTSSTKPSVAQIQAGQDHNGSAAADSGNQSVSATGTQNISATGLSASTQYWHHFQHQDSAGNDSTVVTSNSFTTQASDTTAPSFSSAATDTEGDTVTVTFDEALDTGNDTASGEWTVDEGGSPVTINSAAIDTQNTTDVIIELNSSVAEGATITVSYSGTSLRDDAGNQVSTFTDNAVTNNAVDTVKGVTVTLYDRATQSIRASVTGIVARWWDSPTATGAPVFETSTASTDSNGVLELDLDSDTALDIGQNGYLVLYKEQADPESDWHFAARVAVEDIA